MIGERYAVPARAGNLGAARRPAVRPHSEARPAIAGQKRLARVLLSSVLLQLMLIVGCLGMAGMLYLAQASQVSVIQFNISDLKVARTQLNAQNATLNARATMLRSTQRIDRMASTQLHMAKADLSNTLWIYPNVPRVVPLLIPVAGAVSAQRQSQPLGWFDRFAGFVKSSL